MERLMNSNLKYEEPDLLFNLKQNNGKAFEEVYERYAGELYPFILSKVKVKEITEEIIQDIFISLWENKDSLEIHTSLKSYLFSAAKYKVLNYIRSEKVYKKYALHFALFLVEHYQNSGETLLELHDLEAEIEKIISKLPERCRDAFRMSRMEDMDLDEISEKMGISKRTVENYITRSLKLLRQELINYSPLIILWFRYWEKLQ